MNKSLVKRNACSRGVSAFIAVLLVSSFLLISMTMAAVSVSEFRDQSYRRELRVQAMENGYSCLRFANILADKGELEMSKFENTDFGCSGTARHIIGDTYEAKIKSGYKGISFYLEEDFNEN